MEGLMITTVDNPYSPFTQFEEWNSFDISKGYNTMNYICRIAKTSPDFTEEETEREFDRAIMEIARLNLNGKYKLIHSKEENQ